MDITYCEPHSARRMQNFDDYQFVRWFAKPVSKAEWDSAGEAHCDSGLGFEDVVRCHTEEHKIGRKRKNETPPFVNNNQLLQKVLAEFYVTRAFGSGHSKQWRTALSSTTPWNQVQVSHHHLMSTLPRRLAEMDQLCKEYVAASDAACRRSLPKDSGFRQLLGGDEAWAGRVCPNNIALLVFGF